ncbi:RdgB/HAM1 family non-canonical purine NTP pyrophosphatase [Pelagicoccus mobilis]|uniref:dITP/XTP pyrophosphatase n=1 Tax=Pelagicoccus mobilis TaxID=415221 RepID=A0A934VMI0_9BACT|nr:RdgB/HAM1 family non-canonical purine NTP pyrophosphatase [Pelagicoccus mobilis]MBK1878871.1 RdgB/HAM1 family non-canonical purine NTP pyrophosphatase [Pelagicoccus mobilis]
MRLFLATGNLHKVEELQAMLAAAKLDIEVHTPAVVGGMPEVVEDQDSFSGNALKKARALSAILPDDGWALADDSGLCVDALGGAPGVYSARYAGESASDSDNIDKLLAALSEVVESDRGASFQCHLAIVSPHGEEQVFKGACHGRIIGERRGEGGFGYDPVFIPNGFELSFAELSSEEKAGLSHRGEAMGKLVSWLKR